MGGGDIIVHVAALAEEGDMSLKVTRGTQSVWAKDGSGEDYSEESDPRGGYATIRKAESAETGVKSSVRQLPELPQSERNDNQREQDFDVDSPAIPPNRDTARTRHQSHSTGGDDGPGQNEIPNYAKVNKHHTRSSKGKKVDMSAELPPIAPSHSEPGPSHHQSRRHRKEEHHSRGSPQTGHGTKHNSESAMTTHHPRQKGGERENEKMMKYLKEKGDTRKKNIAFAHDRHKEAMASELDKSRSWEREEVAEYTDEEYIPTGDDSFSITETSLSEEDINLQGQPEAASPRSSKEARWRAGSPYVRHSPLSGYRSATPGNRTAKEVEETQPERPTSAPPGNAMLDDGIPYIKPLFIQQLTPAQQPLSEGDGGRVIIFSEKQADGSTQFYAATPVQSPPQDSSFHTPLTTPPLAQPSTSVAYQPSSVQAKASYGNVTEYSGYYSNPAMSHTVSSLQSNPLMMSTPQQQTQQAPQASPRGYSQSQDRIIRGTKITKLGSPLLETVSSPLAASSPRKSALEGVDFGATAGMEGPGIEREIPSTTEFKLRSLTADKIILGQQLAKEQRQLRVKEVSAENGVPFLTDNM